jgi:hypothetical protein
MSQRSDASGLPSRPTTAAVSTPGHASTASSRPETAAGTPTAAKTPGRGYEPSFSFGGGGRRGGGGRSDATFSDGAGELTKPTSPTMTTPVAGGVAAVQQRAGLTRSQSYGNDDSDDGYTRNNTRAKSFHGTSSRLAAAESAPADTTSRPPVGMHAGSTPLGPSRGATPVVGPTPRLATPDVEFGTPRTQEVSRASLDSTDFGTQLGPDHDEDEDENTNSSSNGHAGSGLESTLLASTRSTGSGELPRPNLSQPPTSKEAAGARGESATDLLTASRPSFSQLSDVDDALAFLRPRSTAQHGRRTLDTSVSAASNVGSNNNSSSSLLVPGPKATGASVVGPKVPDAPAVTTPGGTDTVFDAPFLATSSPVCMRT